MAKDQSHMMLHAGGQYVDFATLQAIPVPEATSTYQPVGHADLVARVKTISQDLLTGFNLKKELYGVNKEGQQLFALLTFFSRINPEHGISIAFRNSLNKSLSIAFAEGCNVFVCDNMALSGDITFFRKHTSELFNVIEDLLIAATYRANKKYTVITAEFEEMKRLELSDSKAFALAGNLFARDIVAPRQLPVVLEQWNKPFHPEFEPRTLYSFYNAVTEALKTSPPADILDKHVALHAYMQKDVKEIIPEYSVIV